MVPASYTDLVGDSGQYFMPQYFTQDCTGTRYGPFNQGYNASWSSDNSGIVSVDASNGTMSCVAPGTANIRAMFQQPVYGGQYQGCPQYPATAAPTGPMTAVPCPTTVSMSALQQEVLANIFPGTKTGIGAVSTMLVGPGPYNYNGAVINEAISNGTNGCPWALQCAGSSTFPVGEPNGVTLFDGTQKGPVQNSFYDEHTATSTASLLDFYNIDSCTQSCNQQYMCRGAVIGRFTINYSFSKGTLQGTPITNTTATKQAQ